MESHTLNIAHATGLPGVKRLSAAFAAFGLPDDGLFGVLKQTANKDIASATVIFRCSQIVRRMDVSTGSVVDSEIDKVLVYPLTTNPAKGLVEVHAGAANGLTRMQEFLTTCLSSAVTVEPIELDIPTAVRKLNSQVERFLVRSVRVEHFSARSHMSGPYSPRFEDSDHGMDFIEAHPDSIATARVRFAAPSGVVSLVLSSKSCFRYSCHEDDNSSIQSMLRKLV